MPSKGNVNTFGKRISDTAPDGVSQNIRDGENIYAVTTYSPVAAAAVTGSKGVRRRRFQPANKRTYSLYTQPRAYTDALPRRCRDRYDIYVYVCVCAI